MSATVTVNNIYKSYGDTAALKGVSLEIKEGAMYGLIGADGAGKSTLLTILTTLTKPDKGTATVLGKNIHKEAQELRGVIGYMPQRFSLYQDLSVAENIRFFAHIFGVSPAEREERMARLLEFSALKPFQTRRAGNLSGGMKQKLALCCALVHRPQLLILDEPTVGVDPVSRREFWSILHELKREGHTILVSTPYLDEARHCDELAFMHEGVVVRNGAPDHLASSFELSLYTVKGAGASTEARESLPHGLVHLYPSSGNLVAAVKRDMAPEEVLSAVRKVAPGAVSIENHGPTIEDVIVHTLLEAGAGS